MRAFITIIVFSMMTIVALADLESISDEVRIASENGAQDIAARYPCNVDDRHHAFDFWIGDGGTFIEFTGEARDGGIYFTAETIDPADRSVTHHKFEFTQNGDDTVRQFWATSTDDRVSWTTIWDGQYERRAAQAD